MSRFSLHTIPSDAIVTSLAQKYLGGLSTPKHPLVYGLVYSCDGLGGVLCWDTQCGVEPAVTWDLSPTAIHCVAVDPAIHVQ